MYQKTQTQKYGHLSMFEIAIDAKDIFRHHLFYLYVFHPKFHYESSSQVINRIDLEKNRKICLEGKLKSNIDWNTMLCFAKTIELS